MIVTITTAGGPRDIAATMIGDHLAVHRSFGCGVPPWTISHLPTGCALVVDHPGDAIDIGGAVAVRVERSVLKLKNPALAEERFPREISSWLAKCQAGRRFVPMKEVACG